MIGVDGLWEENDVDQSLDDVILTMGEDVFLFPRKEDHDRADCQIMFCYILLVGWGS